MKKGRLYRISFLAKPLSGTGTVEVRLANVSGSSDVSWASMPVEITSPKREYTVEYSHTTDDVDDVRVSFLFGEQDQKMLMDRIALRGYRQ